MKSCSTRTCPSPHRINIQFYEYLRTVHRADAIVHLGWSSTHEFLPGALRRVGADDFSRLVLGDLPTPYIYIVDGGEGIQANAGACADRGPPDPVAQHHAAV